METARCRALALPAIFLLATGQAPAPPTEPPPADVGLEESVSVQLVEVGFLATDRRGRPITDLRPDDIEVVAGRRPQRIAFLEPYYSTTPLAGTQAPAVSTPSPAAAREVRQLRVTSPGRWVVLLLDGYTSSARTRILSLEAIRHFVDTELGDTDRAAVALFDGKLHLLQTFTRDREKLRRATHQMEGRLDRAAEDRTSAVEDLLEGMEECRSAGPLQASCAQRLGAAYEDARGREAKDFLYALRALTLSLAPIPDLKAVVLFSDGFARNPFSDAFDAARATLGFQVAQLMGSNLGDRIEREFDGLASEAAVARTSFFTIYPGGGAKLSSYSAARRRIPSEIANPENIDVFQRSEQNYGHGLAELARRTGGHASQGNDPTAQVRSMWSLSGGLYTVGYYLTESDARERSRDVRIRAKRKGVVIESRTEVPPPPTFAALRGTLETDAAPCTAEGRRPATIRFGLDPAGLAFEKVGRDRSANVSVYVSLVDPATQTALFEDYRSLQVTQPGAPPDTESPPPPEIEFTLRVPCRRLLVRASAVDPLGGGRGTFSADME